METVSWKKMKSASRYKKWLEGGGGAGFGRVYLSCKVGEYPSLLKFKIHEKKAETASRYKKWLEGGGGAGFGRVY